MLEKVRGDQVYAQHLYAAMCNNEFTKREMWPILKDERWNCSWRHAGGIIADMREEGEEIGFSNALFLPHGTQSTQVKNQTH